MLCRFSIAFLVLFWVSLASSRTLEADLNQVAKECRHSEAEVARLEADLGDVQSLYYEKTSHLLSQQKKISRLILLLRTLKAEAPSHIIRSDEQSPHVLRNFSIFQCYVRALHKEMQTLQKELSALKQTKEQTSQRKAELNEKLATYQKKYAHLEDLLRQKKSQIQKTLSQRKETEDKAQKLAKRSSSIADLIKHLEKDQTSFRKPSAVPTISLLSPTQGPIITPFNQKTSQNPDGSGVVFRARAGSHILSPVSGKILYAGPFRRYNKILIIGFQKTYSLLLTGLDRLDVSVGQEVHAGDPLGLLPTEDKNYLYLELRNHGVPIKPHILKI
ncbi:MAG: hypothetical protein A2621_01760 [Alphaproteobacteria bacterium RIFCSPHIGHO2_01_FULL_41_14]|nr:MAG: hypothetical protein A2065_00470 [Alphaproteobacteria bacterium GWB1_45_5]OFW76492.1 MAG: hypothetical protein A3K20_04430 [Alphaproteobacteria bacterium GWA1_45_9]OFW89620.1 MAG: hypothetical protein A2621_01760 [Alphaproteobacteria bacterium RIFCSPHIGHO2_01_FULL_41_14]HCI48406.1 hypothetical protein [Holosporales bacterium]